MVDIKISDELQLREIKMTDAPAVFSIIDRDRNYLREWLPFVDYTKMVEDTEAFIKGYHNCNQEQKDWVYVILYNNKVAGITGYKGTDKANHKTEIGYWLAQDMQGKGLVSRTTAGLTELAFEKLNMNRVQIKVATGNIRSKAIPKRLGFQFEGIERNGEFLNGSYADLEIYSMLKKEWKHLKMNIGILQ